MSTPFDCGECKYVERSHRAETAIRAALAMLDGRTGNETTTDDIERMCKMLRTGLPSEPSK